MEHPDSSVLLTLGLLLALALFWGKIAVLLRLPQVTAYLFVGIVLGPSLLNLVPQQHVVFLEPLTELAVALVLFSLGCQFPINRARRGSGALDARSSRTLEVSSLLHRLLPLLGGFPSLSVSFLWQETSAPSPSWFPSPLFAPRDTLDFGSRCRYRIGISKFVS